jgi:isoleucyl-tRNA synthetase
MYFEGHLLQMVLPGIHHVMARAIKIFCRYKTQKGTKWSVKLVGTWFTCKIGTEKELGITKEEDINKISIEEYNEACKKNSDALYGCMEWFDWKNGILNMEDPYVTQTKYMETVWWILKQIYNKIWCTKATQFNLILKSRNRIVFSRSKSTRKLPWCYGYDCSGTI